MRNGPFKRPEDMSDRELVEEIWRGLYGDRNTRGLVSRVETLERQRPKLVTLMMLSAGVGGFLSNFLV